MPALYAFVGRVVIQILNPLILLLAAGAFVLFVWGVFQFIRPENAEKRVEGRQAILWGIIGLVVIFGAYGIINFALGAFDLAPIQKISQ
ncbi:MAG: hypothetical protein ACYC6X_00265 [Minisyncoccota bacterium]